MRLFIIRQILLAGVAPSLLAVTLGAQSPVPFQLRDGVVVDPRKHEVYVMSQTGAVDAIDLQSGATKWTSHAAAKPLAVASDLVFAQSEVSRQSNVLTVVALDPEHGGAAVQSTSKELPASVRVGIQHTLRGEFVASGETVGGRAVISWESTTLPRQGMRPKPRPVAVLPPRARGILGAGTLDAPDITRGTLTLDPRTGVMTPGPGKAAPSGGIRTVPHALAGRTMPKRTLPTNAMAVIGGEIPALEREYLSADGRHVLLSKRVSDDRVWEKYRWTIVDRGTGEQVGEIRSHVAAAPFYVDAGQIIYSTGPYTRDGVSEPLKLRAFDLTSGRERWSTEVRDTALRGPFPP